MIRIIIRLNPNAVVGNKQIKYLNRLELLFPNEIHNASKLMIKIFNERIPKIKDIRQPLPNGMLNIDGSIVIKDYYFNTIVNRLNQIISNQYNGRYYIHIKRSLRSLMTSINHANKHMIANQHGKLLLLKIVKALKTSAHYHNLYQTIHIIVHLISQCLVLNSEAFHDYHFLIRRFSRTH